MARKTYSVEFRRAAVELYRVSEGATISQIASDLGSPTRRCRRGGRRPGSRCGVPGVSGCRWTPVTSWRGCGRGRAAAGAGEAADDREGHLAGGGEIFRRRDELVSRFQFVADHRDTFEVKWLCEAVEVARSSFYDWVAAAPARAQRAAADDALAARIAAVHQADDTYGAPRVTAELNDGTIIGDDGRVNHKRVARVMRARGIAGLRLWRKVRTTIPEPAATPVPDLLERDFTADAPNVKYVGDITYLPYGDGHTTGHLYLATVIDCFSRRLVGWSIAGHMRTELVADALQAACRERGSLAGAVFHADHGAQYTARDFAALCNDLGVTRSMGAVGTSADNALAESFNATSKRETLQDAARWHSADDARHAVFRWVTRYNTRRRHSYCAQTSPASYENAHYAATLQPAA